MSDPNPTNNTTESTDSPRPSWSKLHLWEMQPVRDVLVGLGILMLILLGQKVSVVTVPLILAILLAYLFEPVICWSMRKFSISRRTSVIGIIASVVILVVIPTAIAMTYAAGQLVAFSANTAEHIDQLSTAVVADDPETARALLSDEAGGAWVYIYDQVKQSQTDGSVLGEAFDAAIDWVNVNRDQVAQTAAGVGVDAIKKGMALIGAAFGFGFLGFLTAFFFFFTATEWVGLKHFGAGLLPDKNRETVIDLLQKFDSVISGFIRGRITIAFIQSIVFSIGFFLIGVPGAFILGPIVAVLSIVPYLALVGIPIAVTLLMLQGHTGIRGEFWWIFGAPIALYFLGQALDDYVLTPKIQGKSTGMDTPTILFASIAGGALFGIFGMLIAIPLAACAKILIQEIFWPKFKDWAEGRASDPLPIDG